MRAAVQQRKAATLLAQLVRRRAGSREIDCPRAQSRMTPCVLRDGATACTGDGDCVGCWHWPSELLRELRAAIVREAGQ